jgi:hypothetical protein
MSPTSNYLALLYELDRFTRGSPLGCVPSGAEMHAIARRAELAGPTDTSAAAWTGQLVKHGYVTPGPVRGGERRPQPPPGAWTDADLGIYIDYEVTDKGREEADRIRRLRREAATDAALGIGHSWMEPSQLDAVATPLRSLRNALDQERWVDAAGAAKELVEASSKVVLARAGQSVGRSESVQTLFQRAREASGPAARADTDLARSLVTTVQRVAELRNTAGAGHGHAEAPSIPPRDARMAAAAAVAVSRHLLQGVPD